MKDESKMLAFWLLPAAPAREFFHAQIRELARRFDAPVFEPHLTLYGSAFDDAWEFDALTAMAMPRSIKLEIEGVQFANQYTKTLFVQFQRQPELEQLKCAVAHALGNEDGDELNPHLSLIYQHLPNEQKMDLAQSIQLPFDQLRFDAMKAVITPSTIESRERVESWRTVWERSFSNL